MTVLETGERHQELLDELLSDIEAYNPDVDRELLSRAFRFAAAAHEGQQRRSGEAFIRHPWGAAKILAELRQDEQTIAAASSGHADAPSRQRPASQSRSSR